jgi:hypothetical protein
MSFNVKGKLSVSLVSPVYLLPLTPSPPPPSQCSRASLAPRRCGWLINRYPFAVIAVPGLWVPLVAVGNVYILPGVPHLFERMLLSQTERFRQHKVRLLTMSFI